MLAGLAACAVALVLTAAEALVVGLDVYVNAVTVGYEMFLLLTCWVLLRRLRR